MTIEVQRARVRALAWSLITNRPRDFDISSGCNCALWHAAGMPEFQMIGVSRNVSYALYRHLSISENAEALFGLDNEYFCYQPLQTVNSPRRQQAIQRPRSYCYTEYPMWASYRNDPFHCGVTLLEAIGDCGLPPVYPRWEMRRSLLLSKLRNPVGVNASK